MRIRYLYLIALAAVIGCASAGSGSSASPRNPTLITAEDIAGIPATNRSEVRISDYGGRNRSEDEVKLCPPVKGVD